MALFVLSLCPFDISVGIGAFVIGLGQISSFLSVWHILSGLGWWKGSESSFCDISKAFDRVWHRGLLFKLRRIGITGPLLQWFQSYLENRYQRVAIEGCVSDYQNVQAGVPQGSILGPLLFLIYINDIVIDINSNIRLFEDDTSLEIIHQWAQSWLVNFNPNTTEQMIISRKAVPRRHPNLEMNNVDIQKVNSHKHFGLIINKTCSWYEHILDITTKAWKRINILRSLMYKLDKKLWKLLT